MFVKGYPGIFEMGFCLFLGGVLASEPVIAQTSAGNSAFETMPAAIIRSTLALTNGLTPPPQQGDAYSAFSTPMQMDFGNGPFNPKWTNWAYARNSHFWLSRVRGLEAINVFPYQMQLALVTPRHCLTVAHMQGCGSNVMVCFVGTNNTIYWRRSLGTLALGGTIRACILDEPLPIAPLPVIAESDLAAKCQLPNRLDPALIAERQLPCILFNQRWQAWAADLVASNGGYLFHIDPSHFLPDWCSAVTNRPPVVGGDSGSARCVVIDGQFYLTGVAQTVSADAGMYDIGAINGLLDKLSAQTHQPSNHVTVLDVSRFSGL